jgi:hypothetical protein
MAGQRRTGAIPVALEVGAKRAFATAIEWPGWSRSGKDDQAALEALTAYGPRYAAVLRGARLGFKAPQDSRELDVVERLPGDASTDFGVPGKILAADQPPMDERELRRSTTLFRSAWKALDAAARRAEGKVLTKGPRGGGRDLDQILRHVVEADAGYLARLGQKVRLDDGGDPGAELRRIRRVILDTLGAVAGREPIPAGPRGGARMPPRYFVRRSVWHVLDHAWEIEDRSSG